MYLLLFLHYDNHFHFNGHRQLYNVVPTQRIYKKKKILSRDWLRRSRVVAESYRWWWPKAHHPRYHLRL